MAPLPDYVSGTITLTNGSAAFTGSGTGWLAASFREGDTILGIEDNPGVTYVIESITDNDAGTLTQPWDGPSGTYEYRMRYLADGQRVTAQARTLIELLGNGNLAALAGLSGTPQTLPMFTGTGAMVEVPRTDLVSGANYDVQVDTLADRDAYDGQPEGFSVLVSDMGDGRAAIYSRVGGSGWSDPAYVTGPSITLDVGSVTATPFGSDPDVTLTSVPGGYELDFDLPENATFQSGTITTLDPGEDATFDLVPVTGGYQLDLGVPRGPTGDISGVTPFWQGRITVDTDAAAAREGLGAVFRGASSINNGDWNTPPLGLLALQSLYHTSASAAANAPVPNEAAFGIHVPGVNNLYSLQLAFSRGSDRVFFRRLSDGTWLDWPEFWHSGNLIRPTSGEIDAGAGTDIRGWAAADVAQAIAALAWAGQPIGVPVPVFTDLAGVEAPPTDQAFRYIKLTASDAYNTGALTGESVSGSAPLIQATAVIALASSPLNGQTVRLINTERRVLRAGSAGVVENDQMQQITASAERMLSRATSVSGMFGAFSSSDIELGYVNSANTVGADFTMNFDSTNSPGARAGDETRPKNIGVDYYMRIR